MTEWTDVIDEPAFDQMVLAARHPVVVTFEIGDCLHCREQRSLLSLAWRHLGSVAATARVDIDRLPGLARRYRIVGSPTLAVFLGGRLLERYPGVRDPGDLTRRLLRLLAVRPDCGDAAPTKGLPRIGGVVRPASSSAQSARQLSKAATGPLTTADLAACGCCAGTQDSTVKEDR